MSYFFLYFYLILKDVQIYEIFLLYKIFLNIFFYE